MEWTELHVRAEGELRAAARQRWTWQGQGWWRTFLLNVASLMEEMSRVRRRAGIENCKTEFRYLKCTRQRSVEANFFDVSEFSTMSCVQGCDGFFVDEIATRSLEESGTVTFVIDVLAV